MVTVSLGLVLMVLFMIIGLVFMFKEFPEIAWMLLLFTVSMILLGFAMKFVMWASTINVTIGG